MHKEIGNLIQVFLIIIKTNIGNTLVNNNLVNSFYYVRKFLSLQCFFM